MRLRPRSLALPLFLVGSACTTGAPPAATDTSALNAGSGGYAFTLQLRASEDPSDPNGTFAVPAGASPKNASPAIDDAGDVAIDLITADDLEHVFAGGKIRFTGPDPEATISGTAIDDAGNVVFDVWNGASGNGVYTYSAKTNETSFLSADPIGAESWGNVSNRPASGKIGVRPSGGGRRYLGLLDADGFTKLAVETSTSPSSPYAYLFGPAFDRAGRAALKVQLAAGGNDIRILALGAAPRVVVQDHEANPASPYAALDNGIGFNEAGQVAFVAKVGAARGVYLSDGATTIPIAAEGTGDVARITYFTPVVNDAGTVAFRGMDTQGRNVVWVGNGGALTRVVTAGDVLPSDRGDAVALPEDPADGTTFGGGLAINARGQIAFLAALAVPGSTPVKRLGEALYVATPR